MNNEEKTEVNNTKMNYRLIKLLVLLLGVVTMACGGKKSTPSEANYEYEEWDSVEVDPNRDSTVYGICMMIPSETHMMSMLTDNGDTLQLNVRDAMESGKVLGSLQVGDRLAVLMNKRRTKATMVIDHTTLMGDWVMPNPLDGSSTMGICIKDGGVAESINMPSVIYRSWRLINGDIEIVNLRDDGGNTEEAVRYQILHLTKDSLTLKSAEDQLDYTRPLPEEDYSDLGVELEEGSFDDFVM